MTRAGRVSEHSEDQEHGRAARRRALRSLLSFSLFVAVSPLMGCGSEGGASSPAPTHAVADAAADVAADSPVTDAASTPPDAGTVMRRTVGWRDPFGNYAAKDNLLVDGDFEWAGAFSEQYPWFRDVPLGGMAAPDFVVGMSCRSGTRCAQVAPKSGIAGFATRPPGGADHADLSLWVKSLTADTCAIVSVSVSGCIVTSTMTFPLDTKQITPDPDGWCHFAGSVQMPNDTPCVFVSVNDLAQSSVLVDDVVMSPPAAPASAARAAGKASADHLRVVERLRTVMRDRLGPTPAREPAVPHTLRGKVR